MVQLPDVRLIIEVKNKQPIELMELTKSLVSLGNQFNAYVARYGDSKEDREAKLYVKEIRTGSVIVELIEIATAGMIPFVENINTIYRFAEYCKATYNHFLKGEGDKPDIGVADYRELSQIVSPVAKDSGSQINISTTINGNVEMHLHLGSIEANAFQNIAKSEMDKLVAPEILDEARTKVLLYLWQARNDKKSKAGTKGVIEELSNKPLNIIFDDRAIKDEIIQDQENPFLKVFVVDVKLQTVSGRVAAYKIVKLHESFDKES